MKERNRLGTELGELGFGPKRELEFEGEGNAKTRREIVLVAGVDFPKYDKDGPTKDPERKCKDGVWKLAPATPTGNAWHQRCLNVAKAHLLKDPSVWVTLFDFERGTRSRVTINKKKVLSSKVEDSLGALAPGDYRRVHFDGTKRLLVPIEPVCADAHPARPYIRLCPGVNAVGAGPVEEQHWLAPAKGAKANTKSDAHAHGWSKHGLSILHVYAHIESIGRERPGTLAEFHLFGHASSAHYPDSGTAFVNTDDPLKGSSTARHPLDLDARANFDFLPATIGVTAFAQAFARGATSFVWGCNWFRPIYFMLRTLQDRLAKDQALEDHPKLEFRWSSSDLHGSEDDFRRYFGLDPIAWCKQGHTAQPSGKWVRDKVQRLLDDSYMQKLANASQCAVVGGLPGTYSDYDDDPKIALDKRLSHIPMGRRYRKAPGIDRKTGKKESRVDLRPVLRVFKRYFATVFHLQGGGLDREFGRGFAIYKPKP